MLALIKMMLKMSGKIKMENLIDSVIAYWLHCGDMGQTSELSVCYYCFLILKNVVWYAIGHY